MVAGLGQSGDRAGAAFANNFQKATEARIRKAANGIAEATDVAALKQSTLNEKMTKYSAVAKKAADAEAELSRMRQKSSRDLDAEARQLDKVNKLRVTEANLTKQVTKAHLDLNRARRSVAEKQGAYGNLLPRIDTTEQVAQVGRLGSALANLGNNVTPLGAFGTVGIVALGSALVDVATVAASAAKSMWLLPAAGAAAGAAFGTVTLATMGLDDALKNIRDPQKFSESLRSLAPNAAEVAQSMRQLLPVFDDLQKSTANTFFSGIGAELNSLVNQFAPTIQRLTTGVAGAMNTALHSVGDALMQPGVQQNIDVLVTNIISAFQQLAPAAQPFTQALAQLAAAGSGALPQIATGIANAARAFGEFIDVNSRNGNIAKWLDQGLNTIRELIPLAFSLGKSFLELAPVGEKILPDVVRVLDQVGRIMPEIAAAALLLGPNFGAVGVAAHGVEVAVSAIGTAFSAVESVVVSVVNRIIPVINNVGQAISNSLGPIRTMIDAANALGAGIPNIPEWSGIPQIPTGTQQTYGGANAQRERRGAAPVPLPSANIPGLQTTPIPGTVGGSVLTPRSTTPSWSTPGLFNVPASSGGGGGAAPSSYTGSNANVAAMLQFAAQSNGARYAPASDLANGLADCSGAISDLVEVLRNGRSTPARLFTTANFGSDEEAKRLGFIPGYAAGDLNVGVTPYGPNAHMAATLPNGVNFESGGSGGGVRYGNGAAGALDPQFQKQYHLPLDHTGSLGSPTPVSVESISSQAATDMQQQIGAKLDDDFGVGKGLPGIFENLTKLIANLAFAPVFGALTGVTSAFGSAGPGSGILGAFSPRQGGAGGQSSPSGRGTSTGSAASLWSPSGGYGGGANTTSPGTPGYGGVNGAQSSVPGLGSLASSGPSASYSTGTPWQLANTTGSYNTPSRGVPLGEGLPQSSGIGFGKGGLTGLIGSAAQSAIAAGGMAAGGMDGGAGGAVASAAAQIGIDLLNRGIGYGAQVAGIATQGLMETFLPVESQLADPTRGWLGRIVGGVAGIRPVADNLAGALGKSDKANTAGGDPLSPEDVKRGDKERGIGTGATSNTNVGNINVNANLTGQPNENAKALENLTWKSAAQSGGRR